MTQSAPLTAGAVDAQPQAEAPSALDYRPDGRIAITFGDDTTVVLRRPTLGQYRHWRTLLQELGDDTARLIEQHRDATLAENDEDGLSETERGIRRRQRVYEAQDHSEKQAEAWWTEVFTGLAEGDVPPVDDWPPFLVFGEDVLATVLSHWRSVPLAPGARSNRAN